MPVIILLAVALAVAATLLSVSAMCWTGVFGGGFCFGFAAGTLFGGILGWIF